MAWRHLPQLPPGVTSHGTFVYYQNQHVVQPNTVTCPTGFAGISLVFTCVHGVLFCVRFCVEFYEVLSHMKTRQTTTTTEIQTAHLKGPCPSAPPSSHPPSDSEPQCLFSFRRLSTWVTLRPFNKWSHVVGNRLRLAFCTRQNAC